MDDEEIVFRKVDFDNSNFFYKEGLPASSFHTGGQDGRLTQK